MAGMACNLRFLNTGESVPRTCIRPWGHDGSCSDQRRPEEKSPLELLVDQLRSETLDESGPSTPGGRALDLTERARDLGYRAGHNDRNMAVIKRIEALIARGVRS